MAITFYDEEEAKEYTKRKFLEGYGYKLRKVGTSEWQVSLTERQKFPRRRIKKAIKAEGTVTLYHGTKKKNIDTILREGIKRRLLLGAFEEALEEEGGAEDPEQELYGIWLGATPSEALGYGDTVVEVEIPASWIKHMRHDEVMLKHDIPVENIVEIHHDM